MTGPAALLDRYIEGSPRLHFTCSGADEGRTVVMLHGSTQHAGVWDDVVPVLSGFRVAALDLRGHGRSGHSECYAPEDYTSDVERLVDTLGASSIALVGHSMGSLVAMRYAARHLRAVWAAAFLDIDARPPDLQGNGLRTAGRRPGRAFDTAAQARARIERLVPGAHDALIERMMRSSFIEHEGRFRECYDRRTLGQFARWDNRELLAAIDVPALVLRGGDSAIHGAQAAAEMVAALPDGRFHEFPGGSHMLHIEQPTAVGTVLADFLRNAADRTSAATTRVGA